MTGGGGVMTTSASTGVIYSAPQNPELDVRGWEADGRRKEGKEDERG